MMVPINFTCTVVLLVLCACTEVNMQRIPMYLNNYHHIFQTMCIHLAEGMCIALEVKATDPKTNVVCQLRKLCGPRDPVILSLKL